MVAAGPTLLAPDPDMPQAVDPRAVVTRNWELSLDALAGHGIPQARPLLRMLSCYATVIPVSLLAEPALRGLDPAPGLRRTAHDCVRARHALALVALIDVVDVPGSTGAAVRP